MLTADVTIRLAECIEFGCDTEAEMIACSHVNAAMTAGRAWAWSRTERSLALAYLALGAQPPEEGGYAWHCGKHPLQLAIACLCSSPRLAPGE